MQALPDRQEDSATRPLLQIEARVTEDVYLLEVAGELDLSTVDLLRGHLETAQSGNHRAILVDLSELAFMDGSGLRVLLRAAQAKGTASRLRLMAPSRQVLRVLELTGTASRLPITGSHAARRMAS